MTDSQQSHKSAHNPVLLTEALQFLAVEPGKWYIDGTFGRGGHTGAILKAGGNVIALDCDQDAITAGENKFAAEINAGQLILVHENFDKIWRAAQNLQKVAAISGILFDFGVSSPQLDTPERGFSFQTDAELDMRMDHRLGVKAKDLLAVLPERQLADLFFEYGGEEQSKKIAKVIAEKRKLKAITSTQQLADLVSWAKRGRHSHLHPATKVFQALRMAVNDELGSIERALPEAYQVLAPEGTLVTISFHEGEDRIMKRLFKSWEKEQKGNDLTSSVVTPGEEELELNPRSRSAKLRAFQKLA